MTEEQALREWADQGQADERSRREARMEERAAIVAWLRGAGDEVVNWMAIQIEAGEHLK